MAEHPGTLGELRASGWVSRPVKEEVRRNAIERIRAGEQLFPGVEGYDDTVLPQLENALLAGHDVIFLGERGQAKTRMIRSIVGLLDEWLPIVAGSEINDDPYNPVSRHARDLVAASGDDTPIDWVHRDTRFGEKLATPDTSIADLIGEVDPIKVAEGRYLSDELTLHYGLVPRTNRGIFAINELPDLAERIQVGLLNVLEERDVQVRGYKVRLPLDVMLVASANPEDYTNRGRIITPLKDRFGAEVRTHYPIELADEIRLLEQEAQTSALGGDGLTAPLVPEHLVEIVARFTRLVRESTHVDQRSGVSARFAIAGLETVAASAVRRAAIAGEPRPVARVVDLPSVVPASRGKVEFADSGSDNDDDRELEILDHLLRQATAQTFRARCAGLDLTGLQEHFTGGETVESGELVSAPALLGQLGTIPRLAELLGRLGVPEGEQSAEQAAAAVEFALEGLYLTRRLAKDTDGGRTVYGA